MTTSTSLKEKILRGGFYMTLKQLLTSGFSLVSILVIARILGPEKYGLVSASLGIFYFFRWTMRMGLGVYLIRKPEAPATDAEQVLAFYSTCGVLLCLTLWLCAPAFGWWIGRTEVTDLLRVLIPALWLDQIGNVSMSQLSRNLRFDRVGIIESVSQSTNYLLSVPVVVLYGSYWGPIFGTLLEFVMLMVLARWSQPVRWQWRWQVSYLAPALRYGVSYSLSSWLFNLRSLVVPLLLSRLAGIEAVGIANIAVRMVRQVMLLRNVLKRMSMSIMAKLTDNANATRRAITRGMAYQAMTIGLFCGLFASVASWLVTMFFGAEWLPSARLVTLIGLSTLVGAVFDLHSATLYAIGRVRAIILANAAYVVVLWLSALLLIPSLGVWGYGLAEILAVPTYFLLHRALRLICGSPDYRLTAWLILASSLPAIGAIWLPAWINVIVLVSSYSCLLVCNLDARGILMEAKSMVRPRGANHQGAA